MLSTVHSVQPMAHQLILGGLPEFAKCLQSVTKKLSKGQNLWLTCIAPLLHHIKLVQSFKSTIPSPQYSSSSSVNFVRAVAFQEQFIQWSRWQ